MIWQSSWRLTAAPIIAEVIKANEGKDEKEVRLALRAAYPFGQRRYHPYKIWCDEVNRQLGKKWPIGHKRAWENTRKRISKDQQKFKEWEEMYGVSDAGEKR